MLRAKITAFSILILTVCFGWTFVEAATVQYNLTIAQERVNIAGKSVHGMTINGGIPGPTLRFNEGDIARINVQNTMRTESSIHWHGLLVPPDMDGVPYISFPPIKPGATFTYEFPIRQSGTYWYHSHTGLQEQIGVYGSIVITPRHNAPKADRDYVILLSDWTDENPHEVLRTLKRGSKWYAIEKGSGQSILGAARLGMLGNYFKRELLRMPPMDIADVAYDRFLANGTPESTLHAEPNETVRLRIIDGSSTTYFHLEFSGSPMIFVSADGQDVEPFKENRFLIGVAETYDVLIHVPDSGAYELRATAHDGSGYASVWIGSGERYPAPDIPKPNLYHSMDDLSFRRIFSLTPSGVMGMPDRDIQRGKFDKPGMMGMGSMDMNPMEGMHSMHHVPDPSQMKMDVPDHISNGNPVDIPRPHDAGMPMEHLTSPVKGMKHEGHPMLKPRHSERIGKKHGTDFGFLGADVSSSKDLAVDGMDSSRPWPPYAKLRAIRRTAFSDDKPVREIRLTLDGDMERYVWFLNKKSLSESDSIRIRQGEVARFIMINRTMMHHPMHLHGHFFRVINGQGDYAPLKHTVDVAPMSTTVIEFDANEVGDWFFHCHLLYHMESGMARVVHYEGFNPSPQVAAMRHELYMDSWYSWGEALALTNMTEGFLTRSNTRTILAAEWEVGWQNVDGTEWEALFTWNRYMNRFFTLFAGADLLGEKNDPDKLRGLLGLYYLLPLNLEYRAWIDSDSGGRMIWRKSFDLTPRLELFGEAQYDSHDMWEGDAGLSYIIQKRFSIIGQWHSDYGFGTGLQFQF